MEPLTTLAIYGGAELINGFLNWYGAEKQTEENRKTREENRKMFETQLGFEKEQYQFKRGLAIKQEKRSEEESEFAMEQARKKFETDEADKQFNRQTQFLSGFINMINSGPQIRQSLINTWRAQ